MSHAGIRALAEERVGDPGAARPRNEHAPRHSLTLTGLCCAMAVLAFGGALAQVTQGLERWTFESQRRHLARSGEMRFPPMALIDSAGRPLQLHAGGTGQVMLVDFIYTNCTSICQSLGSEFRQAQEQILRRGPSSIQLLSVSIDPARDTPAAIASHAARHGADPRVWTLATPRTVEDGVRARRALGIIAIGDGWGGFTHNGTVHVVDRQGRVRGIFDLGEWSQALTLATTLEGPGS